MNKTTAIKMVNRGNNRDCKQFYVYVARHAGRTWASNGYWLAPADWFGVIIGDDPADGTYDAKSGSKLNDSAPELGPLFPTTEHPELEPMLLHGSPVMLARPFRSDLALFAGPDGAPTALDRSYVDMFRAEAASVAGSELAFRQETPLKCCAVYRSMSYTWAHGPTDKSWTLTGLIMPVRLDG